MSRPLSQTLTDRFSSLVAPGHALTDPALTARYADGGRGPIAGAAGLVLRPGTVAEVAAIVRLAAETGTPLVPQGGNTGLVGGQVPAPGEVVVALERLDAVRAVDPAGDSLVVEAGATLATVHAAADAAGRLFPLTLASQESCQIGGTIATNAGGTAVLAYGSMRAQVLGLEVVLADGRVWNGLRRLAKDNAGYDLKQLFIGSEGTLGIITAAALRLHPRPAGTAVAVAGVASPHRALALLARCRAAAGAGLSGFELMSATAVGFALRHIPALRAPLARPAPWLVLIEIAGASDAAAEDMTAALLAEADAAGEITDAVLALSPPQRRALWAVRHALSEAEARAGASIKHDVSVPVAAVPDFLDAALAAVEGAVPGIRPSPFGHMGDGNIHFNVVAPEGSDRAAFLARRPEINALVYGLVRASDGSIAAEHGIGRLKPDLLAESRSAVELDLMATVKAALDPRGIFAPGRIIPRS